MSNLARLFPHDDVLTLQGTDLDLAIARHLSYRLGSELPIKGREHEWFAPGPDRVNYQPVGAAGIAFSTNCALVMGLPLPVPTDCCEDWIHTEMGPRGRYIVRLIRFYRSEASHPWKSRELYVADGDDDPIPLATAYGRAWLFSHSTWPGPTMAPIKKMTLAT